MPGAPLDPTVRPQGPDAALTIAGIAVALMAGLYRPGWAIATVVAGVVLILVGLVKTRATRLIGRLGLGLAVGAALLYVLAAMNLLQPVAG